ncbi:MAG: ABC transporter permease [Corallococcus sp.]|nr:ABC transporter permease [Corallococcus sp.]
MISILRVELFRLKKSGLFWTMLGLCFAFPLLGFLSTIAFIGNVGEGVTVIDILKNAAVTESYLSSLTDILSNASLFSLITVSIFLSKEFADGTVRNVILANKSRAQLYFSYYIIALFVGITYLLAQFIPVALIIAPVCGIGAMSAGEVVTSCLCSFALGLFAVLFTQSCVCMFLFGVRKQWAAWLLPLLVCAFGPAIFETIVAIRELAMAFNGVELSYAVKSWIPFVNANLFQPNAIDGGLILKIILYYGVFSAIFVASGYFTFEKADLK